jgi:hypothetical protein
MWNSYSWGHAPEDTPEIPEGDFKPLSESVQWIGNKPPRDGFYLVRKNENVYVEEFHKGYWIWSDPDSWSVLLWTRSGK